MGNKKEKTREHILDVSYGVFAEKGFNKVTMKDICEAADISRGCLYSHFSGTGEILERLLSRMAESEEMDFYAEMKKNKPADEILEAALKKLKQEMCESDNSLSLAMYEFAGTVKTDFVEQICESAREKWTALIKYGVSRGEFKRVNIEEVFTIIMFAYQGVRMWGCIFYIEPEVPDAIVSHIKKLLLINDF